MDGHLRSFIEPAMGNPLGVSKLARLRSTQKSVLKAQRRVWLLQAAVWPTVVLAGAGAVAAGIVRFRGRHTDGSPAIADGLPHL